MKQGIDVIKEDGLYISNSDCIDWKSLEGKTIFVTGATGLIGMNVVRGILAYNAKATAPIKVIALVRNIEKAEKLFGEYDTNNWIMYEKGDILSPISIAEKIDFIIHGASVTASKDFVEKPVETILTAIEGTKNILELARKMQVEGMVYMSSMEVYGTPNGEELLSEEKMGYLNPLALRSSYSESKQMVENLCVAYNAEYDVPVKIVRLTQTFGPGVAADDGRVFAEFARCAVEKRDICLQTEGKTKRMYLYTADAVTAILTVLTKGASGEAYNVANKTSYCSIKEMAQLVAQNFGQGMCNVVIAIPDTPNTSYNPVMCVNLDTLKLESLGWKCAHDLTQMYERMIICMK